MEGRATMRRTSTGAGVGRLGRLAAMAWVAVLVAVGSAGVAAAGANRWTTHGPEGGRVNALALDPGTPATVYAGTDGGVFTSTTSRSPPSGVGATQTACLRLIASTSRRCT